MAFYSSPAFFFPQPSENDSGFARILHTSLRRFAKVQPIKNSYNSRKFPFMRPSYVLPTENIIFDKTTISNKQEVPRQQGI